ncbi:MAG TPA: M57 family metalloprotease [Longimicrobium sp.]|nr:M57 family metalloprotease [Longimicrobium sp.]
MIRHNRSHAAYRAAALLLAGALAACSDAPTSVAPKSEATLAQQVAALGFRADMIEDHGDYVLVEGDIHLTKAYLRTVPVVDANDPLKPRFQYRTNNLVSSPKVQDIRVDVSALASEPGWQQAARDAMVHWSGISNSYVRLVEAGPADITVAATCTSSNVAAYASWPSAGNPGPTIYVNSCFGYYTSHAQKVHNMVHEFGHTLGFRHSNYVQNGESAGTEGAVHIPNTPTSGNATGSVMNGGTALNSWAGFAASDLTATRSLYPLPAPSVSVTNNGGYPQLSWGALVGASSYDVVHTVAYSYNNRTTYESYSWTDEYPLGNTTGTSFLDSSNIYTGVSFCSYNDGYGGIERYTYRYRVTATFANGTSTATVAAPVAQC